MPKETINYPEPTAIAYALTQADIDAGAQEHETIPAGPQIALHWHPGEDSVQLSFSIDADLIARIIATREDENPDYALVAEPGRAVFYTETLDRPSLQRLIKTARRARDAAFGSDE